ncbi:MAG TPA: hypothetical protein VGS07_16090 [Thermoanaerobaculia bacterium]|jgi:hypothetical protein|nr:hypothetical protein [Thermoanaerobaculia bacterium]
MALRNDHRSGHGAHPPAWLDAAPEARPTYSRSLLLPGPLPPLSHFGITLLRYALGTGLRYALYHLGYPLPETPPVKIIRLRPYLDARELRTLLLPAPGGADVVGALLEPGGTGDRPAEARALAAALSFHRVRLLPFRVPRKEPALRGDESPQALWSLFRTRVSRVLVRTNDALLSDLASALDRRALRARGEDVPPALSKGAWTLRTRGRGDLRRFGVPDLLAPSWAEEPDLASAARHALEPHSLPGHDRYRGRFRESWRAGLSQLAPIYRALARSAAERGHLADPTDAFFLPLDTAEDLTAERKPAWVESAVRGNRLEYDSLRKAAEPLDLMTEKQEMGPLGGDGERPEWGWTPLLPLP